MTQIQHKTPNPHRPQIQPPPLEEPTPPVQLRLHPATQERVSMNITPKTQLTLEIISLDTIQYNYKTEFHVEI